MHPFDEMKAYVRFDADDEANLRALWPHVEPHTPRITDAFYDRILEFDGARAVFEDDDQVNRLKQTLRVWIAELLNGPWDHAFYERHQRIGRVHVAVGLPHRYMFTAMSFMRDELCEIAHEHMPAPSPVCRALDHITVLDLAIMTGNYMAVREQRQLATLQDLLVSHLPVTVLLVDHDGRITTTTRPATRLLGGAPVDGRHYLEALPGALVAAADLPHHVGDALASGHDVTLLRVDARIGDRPRSFRLDIVPFQHPLAAFLLHVEELTATVEAEARMQRSEALARLGSLSAAVAHELRNPLAGISGALQVLARGMDEGDRRTSIMGQVLTQIRRLDGLVSELLAFARPKAAELRDVDLADAAAEVARALQGAWPALNVRVRGAGHAVADPDMLHRLLLNLGTNAAQATQGEGNLQLHVDDGLVTVIDDGPGIPDDHLDRVFEPFFTTKTQGTGLGLAICRQSAEAMNGSLVLHQTGPEGTAFQVRLHRGRG